MIPQTLIRLAQWKRNVMVRSLSAGLEDARVPGGEQGYMHQ